MNELVISKRLEKFKKELIQDIPKVPNNRNTIKELEDDSLSSVIFHFVHWKHRFVAQRPRKIVFYIDKNSIEERPKWEKLENNLEAFFKKVKDGENLTLHLSNYVNKRGYVSRSELQNGKYGRWHDKDMYLNCMSFYHFHLGLNIDQKTGMIDRTKEVLFAKIDRDEFCILGIFDHAVFHETESEEEFIKCEKEKLWKTFDNVNRTSTNESNAPILQTVQTFSGHPVHITQLVNNYIYNIELRGCCKTKNILDFK